MIYDHLAVGSCFLVGLQDTFAQFVVGAIETLLN